MRNKSFGLIFLLVLMVNLSYASALDGAVPATVMTGGTGSVKAGQTVDYAVAIENNSGLAGFHIFLDYDTTVFSVEKEGMEVVADRGSFSTKGSLYASTTETGCQVLWYHTENVTGNGTMFIVHLKVSDTAEGGRYPIKVRYKADDTITKTGELVPLSCVDGAITVQALPTLGIGEGSGLVGKTVTVPVWLKNNPGIAGFTLQVTYQPQELTLISIRRGPLLNSESGNYARNVSEGVITWFDSVNTQGDGVICYLDFTVLTRDHVGKSAVSVALQNGLEKNFVNINNEPVTVNCQAGSVRCRVGELVVLGTAVNAERTALTLTVEDAPSEPIAVLTGFYDKGAMVDFRIQNLTLPMGTMELCALPNCTMDTIKVFFLKDSSWVPLAAPESVSYTN